MRRVRKFNNKKVEVDGITFDSKAEAEFYKYLRDHDSVEDFKCQPHYVVLEDYMTRCVRCQGEGNLLNEGTGNANKCTLCRGVGRRKKRGITYTADFAVTWKSGKTDVIDVKGGPTTPLFNAKRKLFEAIFEIELLIVRKNGKGWVFER